MDEIQAMIYEDPVIASLGPHWSAICAGFAVLILGKVYVTDAGQRYIDA